MKQTQLGRWGDGELACIDIDRLMETRALIQANSGGGKSWLLRKLLEVTAGQVQQFIIDPEGEFASLREKHDLIVASASGGDALAHPRTARLLAIRLLETQASAVLDLYELKAHERHQFVRIFLESMMNAPKTLWRPVLVALDESHLFAPEKGQGESEATEAVIDLATRGRKRGFALVAATQRIGKFHKSAAAELKNKLIGSTGLDVDVKRAAFDLGLQPREALEKLRALQAGDFFAFGPALNQVDPRELVVGKVATTHPQAGSHKFEPPPPPTAAIRALMPKLADLPKEAEEEARTMEDLRRENTKLKRELAQKPAPAVSAGDIELAERRGSANGFNVARKQAESQWNEATAAIIDAVRMAVATHGLNLPVAGYVNDARPENPVRRVETHRPAEAPQERRTGTALAVTRARQIDGRASSPLSAAARKILGVLAQFPDGCKAGKLTLLTGYKYSGSFQNALSELRTAGLIAGANTETMTITSDGLAHGPFPELPSGRALGDYWLQHPSFGKAARDILRNLLERPKGMTAEQLCDATGYSYSGSFQNALSELRTAGVLVGRNTEVMRANEDLFS
jgi:hypothetical protein